jgi:peptide/nickel transport system substrate-binding protein
MRLRGLASGLVAMLMAISVAPVTAQSPADTLTVTRLSDMPPCFHPICFQTGNQYMNFQLVFNSLIKVDSDESTIIGDLAETWEVSPDARTFTFGLDPDAVWHDGEPVTADDVIYTISAAAQMADAYVGTYPITNWTSVEGAADVLGTADVVAGLERIDDHTVAITLADPNAVFLRNLADPAYMIMPEHILGGLSAEELRASDFVNGVGTIGSGPYKLVSYTPGTAVEYDAHEQYHKGAPNIKKLIYVDGVDPSTAAAQLQSGELDMVLDLVPTDFDVLDPIEGISVVRVAGIGVEFLQFPVDNPQVADKRIRQAIYHGFDRRTVLATVFQGAGEILWGPPAFDLSDPELNRYEYDPERARELVDEAVAEGAFDLASPLRLIYFPEQPGWEDLARTVQDQLATIGLQVELQPSDAAGWTAALPETDTYEITLQCCGSFFHPDRSSGAFNCEAPTGTMYANCEVDQLFRDARATGDAAEQAEIYAQIARILNEDAPYNWLWFVGNTHANNERVGDFEYYPNARETFSQIEKWTLSG